MRRFLVALFFALTSLVTATNVRAQCSLFEADGTLVQSGTCLLFQPQTTSLLYELDFRGTFQAGDCVFVAGFLTSGGSLLCPASVGQITENSIAPGCIPSGPPVAIYCAGDGLDPQITTPCPCGNTGAPGNGCANSVEANGSFARPYGSPNFDRLGIQASGMPSSAAAIFLKGNQSQPGGLPFGDGLRCVDGALIRLGLRSSVNGCAHYPGPGDPAVSTRGGTPLGSGLTGYYQVYYRNAAAFCTAATFNATNAFVLTW